MATERTFAMIKPDGVKRNLVGAIVARIEAKGYRIVGLKQMVIPREMAERHYGEHQGKPFFDGLVSFITSGPVVAMVLEGENAISRLARHDGRHQPEGRRPGHHPWRLRHHHRRERGARLRCPGHRRARDRHLLRRGRPARLSTAR
jgi:nucleoside-diphosphate kinase